MSLKYIFFLFWSIIPVFSEHFHRREASCKSYVFTNIFEKVNDQRLFLLGAGTNILMSAIKWRAFTTEIGFWSN